VPVADVDRAKEFYAERLGFAVDHDTTINADIRIVHCDVPAEVALARITARSGSDPRRSAHEDAQISPDARLRTHNSFQPVDLPVPSITIDTTYEPALDEILAFLS